MNTVVTTVSETPIYTQLRAEAARGVGRGGVNGPEHYTAKVHAILALTAATAGATGTQSGEYGGW